MEQVIHDTESSKATLKKEAFKAPLPQWMWALAFLLSLSAVGLSFYPAMIFVIFILVNRFVKDKSSFLIMVTIMASSPGFIPESVMGFRFFDPLLALSLIGFLLYRKNLMVKKISLAIAFYILFLFGMSMFSDETLSIQFLTLRRYTAVALFILPLWLYANRKFDTQDMYRKILVFFLLICCFYVLDGFVFRGWLLLPGTYSPTETYSTFWDIHISPTGAFPRKYPSGMFIIILAAYPLSRYYRLKWWQWAIVVLAFGATRTMTVIAAFILTYVTFQGKFLRFAKYTVMAALAIVALYFVDSSTGGHMRIASTVEQFASLSDSQDSDDLAEFGSSRMGQIIPKYEALVEQNCLAQGFGFIHPTKTTLPRYQIRNDYYSDIAKAEETAALTEVTQFNTIIHTGIIGLIVQCIFYIGIFFLLKPGPQAQFYLSSIMMASIMGIGGFGGLTQDDSLMYVALALGIVLLDMKNRTAVRDTTPANEPAAH